jgi:hypothetical protein
MTSRPQLVNVMAYIEGIDPVMKKKVVVSAHW